MSARLARMVVRVPRGLDETLTDVAGRLFDETDRFHSLAAVIRGLIAIGLAAVADTPKIAPLFDGVRIARGRKKGTRCPT